MNEEGVRALVRAIREHGAEPPAVEVKSAVGGLPKSVPETLSAFSNRDGGMLILGLDEAAGDGDRRLTEYEIALLHANRGQPRDDASPVVDATIDDLDRGAVIRLLDRVTRRQPRAFRDVPDQIALRRLGVLVPHEDKLVPSLAGLLALGAYPQQFFPQLNVTFVVIPATSVESVPAEGPRYLDNRTTNGAIPEIVEETLTALIRNMGTRALIQGAGREDVYDYPVEALREAVVNALMHRDYSVFARGTQVQIEMYSDRLVVRNPGGLFGPVTEEDLGAERVSSSRNSYLAALLQEVTIPETNRVVCENRGTGIPTMLARLHRAGMSTPKFENRISRFVVTFPKHTLLSAETVGWVSSLSRRDRTSEVAALFADGKELGLAEVVAATGLGRAMAARYLDRLVAEHVIVATAPPRSRHRRYRRATS
jgi:ATP-dependent DNA helicase RecG